MSATAPALAIELDLYLRATPAEVWRALTDPDWTARYWFGMRVEADDWAPGALMRYVEGGRVTDEHTLLHVTPGERLAFRFHPVFTPAYAAEAPGVADLRLALAGEGMTHLRLRHDGFPPDSIVYPACRVGWPMILSNLKTLLETGQPLPPFNRSPGG